MYIVSTIAQNIMTVITLLTAFGVFMHDGRVDRATVTALHRPFATEAHASTTVIMRVKDFVQTDAHTHPDHNAARSGLLNSFAYKSPSIPPRGQGQKGRVLQGEPRGRHAFDNNSLPILT